MKGYRKELTDQEVMEKLRKSGLGFTEFDYEHNPANGYVLGQIRVSDLKLEKEKQFLDEKVEGFRQEDYNLREQAKQDARNIGKY